ncbi:MAG: MBL fold metallo-hydrolase [Parvibaculum sp.]
MRMRATILGCGSSGGVPRIGPGGGYWGACDPDEPKNRRRRCSLLIEQWDHDPTARTVVLVDTAPEMRDQLIDADTGWADAVLFTHDHADQCHGIDDLRMLAINKRRRVDCWMDQPTHDTLLSRFGYCFREKPGSGYPAILNDHLITHSGQEITIDGPGGQVRAVAFDQDHGNIRSLGFRFGPLAYSADAVGIPDESFALLNGIDCWIVDALRYAPHPTHAHVDMALSWLKRAEAKRGVLTNLHVDLDYATLKAELPAGVEPAFDGMRIEFDL